MPNNCESRKEKKSGARVEREKKKEKEEEKKRNSIAQTVYMVSLIWNQQQNELLFSLIWPECKMLEVWVSAKKRESAGVL